MSNFRERKSARRRAESLSLLTPAMERAKAALARGPLKRNAGGDFLDAAGTLHVHSVIAGLARRNLAAMDEAEARQL